MTPAERAAWRAWRARLEGLGVQLSDAGGYVLAVVAVRQTRLRELTAAVANARKQSDKMRMIEAERKASAAFAQALDLAERTFGAAVGEEAVAVAATGTTGRVVEFPRAAPMKARATAAQRIVAALNGGRSLTKAELRRRVPGAQGVFLAGLAQAVERGDIVREGPGSKSRPYHYRRST